MNTLAKKFKNTKLAFISISFEKPERLRSFLRVKEVQSMVGSDTSYSTINAYGIKGYPMVFLIDRKGIIRWKGSPMALNVSMISQFLNVSENKLGIKKLKAENSQISELGFKNPAFSLDIHKNTTDMGNASGMQSSAKELTITNYSTKKTLTYLLDESKYRIKVPDSANTKYDIKFKVTQGLDSLNNLKKKLAYIIANRLNYNLVSITKENEVNLLNIVNDSLFSSNFIDHKSSHKSTSTTKNNWKGHGLSKKEVIDILENNYNEYFESSTIPIGKYKMNIPINDFNYLRKRLLNFYGINLIKETRKVRFFRLTPE